MNRFLQLHLLTDYPPSNPNRDDLGRPKSAVIGGVARQRISSQAIKRAIRRSPAFAEALQGNMGQRTQRMGEEIIAHLIGKGAGEEKASTIAKAIVPVFGKLDDKRNTDKARTSQLAFVSPDERALALDLADKALGGEAPPKDKDLAKIVLRKADGAVDIAMFGRMLADNPDFNRDAAVQVAHAFTVNAVRLEDDYYTAVDDLKKPSEDMGAGFVGESAFGAGVYYLYLCVNRDLLIENLGGDRVLAAKGLEALVRATAEATPTGKINSYGNHTRAAFMLAELGDRQPRSLASAFTKPVDGSDQMGNAVQVLMKQRERFACVYGKDWSDERTLNICADDSATIDELAVFAHSGLADT